MQVLAFSTFANFTQETVLDGTPYRLVFIWNARGSLWTVSFYDLAENPIVQGIPVRVDQELFGQYHAEAMPPGQLYAADATGRLTEITRNDIAEGLAQLVYVPEAEV